MSEPEDERLRAARIKAALAFFGPKRATLRAALEGAGFKVSSRVTQDDWVMGPTVSQSWPDRYGATNPKLGGLRFHARFTATRCRFWLLGLPEEWEVSEGAYERARGLLLSGPEGVSLMLAGEAHVTDPHVEHLERIARDYDAQSYDCWEWGLQVTPSDVLSLLSRVRAAEARLERLEAGRRDLWAEIERLVAAKDESNYLAGLRDAWADWALASDDPAAYKESDE